MFTFQQQIQVKNYFNKSKLFKTEKVNKKLDLEYVANFYI